MMNQPARPGKSFDSLPRRAPRVCLTARAAWLDFLRDGGSARLRGRFRLANGRSGTTLSMSHQCGAVAQLGERCNRTAEVRGSIPLSSIL